LSTLLAALAVAAGLAIALSSESPAIGVLCFSAAAILEALPGRLERGSGVTLSPAALAVLAGMCGIPEGMAAGSMVMLISVLSPLGAAQPLKTRLRRTAAALLPLLPTAALLLGPLARLSPASQSMIFLGLLIAGRTVHDCLFSAPGCTLKALQWIPAGAVMALAVLLSLSAIQAAGTAGALLLLPMLSFAMIAVLREKRLSAYRGKTSELAVQNLLASELAASRSTTDFLGLVAGYLSPSTQSAVTLFTRQGSGSGWVGWTSSEQRTFDSFPMSLRPPSWNEMAHPVRFLGREGVLTGLSPASEMLLFADGAAAETLREMRPDVRGNLVSLIAHAWLVVGHSLTIDGAFIAAAMILARLADSKDDYTHGHSIRVARLSDSLGRYLGLSGQRLRTLRVGALLHDLGKVAVPAEILTKRGLLTREERNVIERHPAEGTGILGSLSGYEEVRDIVRCHHERLDGKGYPAGISGRRIPFLARIVAVADTFDAITSSRSYRADADPATALEAIRAGSGTQFDARVVGALEEMMVGQP
jgi:putative nucleotidyltransferase with HDIG domain